MQCHLGKHPHEDTGPGVQAVRKDLLMCIFQLKELKKNEHLKLMSTLVGI